MSAAHVVIGVATLVVGVFVCKTALLVSEVKRTRYTTLRDEVGRD